MSEAIARPDMLNYTRSPLASVNVADPRLYEHGTWGPLFARLRREDPVHYCADSALGAYWTGPSRGRRSARSTTSSNMLACST
jgi:hypothetical protein